MNTKICVIGSFNVDMTSRIPRFPLPGESLIADSNQIGAGGKGYNQAVAAASCNGNVHFITKIGQDEFGSFAQNTLHHSPIQDHTILKSQSLKTGSALIYVSAQDANNMICVDLGANMDLNDDDITICRPHIENAALLLIQLENNLDALHKIVQIADQASVPIILNPAPYQALSQDILSHIWLCTPNQIEAELMTGIRIRSGNMIFEDAQNAANYLHQAGIKNVVITLGADGAFASTPEGAYQIPIYPCQKIDTTGAGDAFNGAFVAQKSQNIDTPSALLFASCYAALVVEQHGANTNTITQEQCYERMQAHPNIKLIKLPSLSE